MRVFHKYQVALKVSAPVALMADWDPPCLPRLLLAAVGSTQHMTHRLFVSCPRLPLNQPLITEASVFQLQLCNRFFSPLLPQTIIPHKDSGSRNLSRVASENVTEEELLLGFVCLCGQKTNKSSVRTSRPLVCVFAAR